MNLANGIEGEPDGVGNYVFDENDLLDITDPLGSGSGAGSALIIKNRVTRVDRVVFGDGQTTAG